MAEVFGKYQLHEKIAQGGMAEVFLASKKGDIGGFTRRVAIKRMFPHLVDRDEIITMFIDEARIASQLHHPNIVQIYDLGVVDGTFFIAMEFVEGYDLRQVCKQGIEKKNFISRPLAVHIVSEVAVGLDYAHTQTDENDQPMNIVHRDVSPQNVLISVDGAVKVCDFGIAKAEDRLTQTQVGEFKGKFSYMSPEQFASEGLDRRSDIFALGVVLYETTVGVRLFKARSEFETIRRITEGDFKRPSQVRPDYPRRLEEIVLKALAVDPDQRYQSAGLMQEALEEWLFEQRVRTGRRQLAGYLQSLMDEPSLQTGAGAMGNSPPSDSESSVSAGPGASGLEIPIDPSPARPTGGDAGDDATVELSVSQEQRENLLELRGSGRPSSEEAEPTVDDLGAAVSSMEEILADRSAEKRREQSASARSSSDSSQTVEVRRISPEQARQRRTNDAPAEADDKTLVDGELDQETTQPDDSAPQSVRSAGPGNMNQGAGVGPDAETRERPGLRQTGAQQSKGPSRGDRPERSEPRQRPGSGSSPQRRPEPSGRHRQPTSSPQSPTPGASNESAPKEKAKSERSTDSLVAEMPDLKPGGRQLTGLNEMNESEGAPDSGEQQAEPTSKRPATGTMRTTKGGTNWQRVAYVGGGFVTVLVVGIAVAMVVSTDEDEAVDEQPSVVEEEEPPQVEMIAQPVGDREVSLRLETDPGGAYVVANGVLVEGTTPVTVPLVDGRDNEIWIRRRNHRPHRLLIPADGESMEREVELDRSSATDGAAVDFISEPEGAAVYVNGERYGNAPFRMENVGADFESHIQFEAQGYRPFVAFINFDSDRDNRLEVQMQRDDEIGVTGIYDFRPAQSRVILDGQELGTTPFERLHHRDEWLELDVEGADRQARHHRLRLDQIGGFKMAMELEREARETGLLSVEVEPAAAVYVDARAFGAAPLEEVELPAGEQRVIFETQEGKRVRVPLEIEADTHRKYRVVLDGDEADVESIE